MCKTEDILIHNCIKFVGCSAGNKGKKPFELWICKQPVMSKMFGILIFLPLCESAGYLPTSPVIKLTGIGLKPYQWDYSFQGSSKKMSLSLPANRYLEHHIYRKTILFTFRIQYMEKVKAITITGDSHTIY